MPFIHKDVKDVIPRAQALMIAFGWQGGTLHQLAKEVGIDVHDLIYTAAQEYTTEWAAGWFAYNTNTLEFNQDKLLKQMRGNLQFWIGVAGGVQTCLKLKKETPRKF